jgi:hypothetical protein
VLGEAEGLLVVVNVAVPEGDAEEADVAEGEADVEEGDDEGLLVALDEGEADDAAPVAATYSIVAAYWSDSAAIK